MLFLSYPFPTLSLSLSRSRSLSYPAYWLEKQWIFLDSFFVAFSFYCDCKVLPMSRLTTWIFVLCALGIHVCDWGVCVCVCMEMCVYMTFLTVAASVAQLEQYFAGQSTGNWPRGERTVVAMKRSFSFLANTLHNFKYSFSCWCCCSQATPSCLAARHFEIYGSLNAHEKQSDVLHRQTRGGKWRKWISPNGKNKRIEFILLNNKCQVAVTFFEFLNLTKESNEKLDKKKNNNTKKKKKMHRKIVDVA